MLTTVQDLGRPGHTALGVPAGGAFDAPALRAGNRLVGNDDHAAGLECTLIGPTLRFEHDATVALSGAETATREPMPWTRLTFRAGDKLRIGSIAGGARLYLCIGGGLRVPLVMGSASTLLSAGFGGHMGRTLKAGDRLAFDPGGLAASARPHQRIVADLKRAYADPPAAGVRTLRAVDGPHPHAFNAAVTAAFWTATFRVGNQSNRTGLRLEGPTFSTLIKGDKVSEGAPVGGIQITTGDGPGSGQPIALGVDGPTTGGYPIIATIATVDLHLLGQARPGEKVRFERIARDEARRALIDRACEWEERGVR
ncbi:MAG: biotin-dependent carboxyltransferase family protein, partial [Phycisphaerales bacterium]|nr:biotin-dependent carboxyltransferase family protein [Phycisphaerales bacterium]